MENRSGLVVNTRVTAADGYGRTRCRVDDDRGPAGGRVTLGGDKGYDYPDFVADLRQIAVTPHVAQNTTNRRSAIDAPHHATSRVRDQSTTAEARRGSLRLDEDDRHAAEAAASRSAEGRVDFPIHGGGVQPDPDPKSRVCERMTATRAPAPLPRAEVDHRQVAGHEISISRSLFQRPVRRRGAIDGTRRASLRRAVVPSTIAGLLLARCGRVGRCRCLRRLAFSEHDSGEGHSAAKHRMP